MPYWSKYHDIERKEQQFEVSMLLVCVSRSMCLDVLVVIVVTKDVDEAVIRCLCSQCPHGHCSATA